MQEKLDLLKSRAQDLDQIITEFTDECREIAKDLTDRLSKRRKKYRISVKLDIKSDLIRYEFDIFINDRFYVTSYPIDFDKDFDVDWILKECDKIFEEICEK